MSVLLTLVVTWNVAAAQTDRWDRPATLAPSATWPSASDWTQATAPDRAPDLLRIQGVAADGRRLSVLARAYANDGYEDIRPFGGDTRQVMAELGCSWTRCELSTDHQWLSVTERQGAPPSLQTQQAWRYATVLRRFEGPLYAPPHPNPTVARQELPLMPTESDDVHTWLDEVLATAYTHRPRERVTAAQVAFEMGRYADALTLARTYQPQAVCSRDNGPQAHAGQLAVYAQHAGRTGWQVDATVQSFEMWGVPGMAIAARPTSTALWSGRPSTWSTDFAGIDGALLLEGMVTDLDTSPPHIMWPMAHAVFQQLPLTEQQALIQRAQHPALDPWHQLILLLVTDASIEGAGADLRAVWTLPNTSPMPVSALQAQALAAFTSDGS